MARSAHLCTLCRCSDQGDHATLIASITQRLWPMGDETVFIPGHGPESSFGQERRSNPYVRGT